MIGAVGIAAVLVVVGLFVVGKKVTPPATTASASAFTDPTSHFRAQYQHTPVEDDQTKAIGSQSLKEVLWSDAIDANTAEIVGYADFPANFDVSATPNGALNGSVNGQVTNSKGTLVSKTFGTYQGFHSVDAVISASGGYVETRTVLAGRSLYIVVVTSLNNPPELFTNFANSLQILNHAS